MAGNVGRNSNDLVPANGQAAASWYIGIAAIVASGTGVIVDEVFLRGGESHEGVVYDLTVDTSHGPSSPARP